VRAYYSQFEEDITQALIDAKVKEFEGRMAGGLPFPFPPQFPAGYPPMYPYPPPGQHMQPPGGANGPPPTGGVLPYPYPPAFPGAPRNDNQFKREIDT